MSPAAPAPRAGAFDTALVLALNALPLWGVLAGEWSIGALMLLFWLENLFAGGFQALRMLALPGPPVLHGMKFVVLPFFAVHYGGFAFVHGMFVYAQFIPDGFSPGAQPGFWLAVAVALGVQGTMAWQLHRAYRAPVHEPQVLQASHKDPHVARTLVAPLTRLMIEPYVRVGILHVVLVIGAFASLLLGTPLASLVLLVLLKAGYELAQARGLVRRFVERAH